MHMYMFIIFHPFTVIYLLIFSIGLFQSLFLISSDMDRKLGIQVDNLGDEPQGESVGLDPVCT